MSHITISKMRLAFTIEIYCSSEGLAGKTYARELIQEQLHEVYGWEINFPSTTIEWTQCGLTAEGRHILNVTTEVSR